MPKEMNYAGNPVLSTIPAYVEENADQLIARSAVGARSLGYFNIQTGVKGDQTINILETDIKFKQNADTCGFNPEGTQGISQRQIKSGIVAVNTEYCPKNMWKKYLQTKLNIEAGRENLPFQDVFINDVIRDVKEKLDALVWLGDTGSMDQNLKPFDGMIKVLKNESAVIDVAILHETAKIEAVNSVLMAIPAKALKDDTRIFCAPSFMRGYAQEMVKANLYHFAPGEDLDEFQIPGSKVKLVALEGLETKPNEESFLVGARTSNLYYGTDLENGEEIFDFWFSKDDRKFKLDIEFNGGVQVAWPDEVVLGTIAGAEA